MLTLTEFSVAMHFLLTPFMRKIIILWNVRKYRFSSVMYRTRNLCRFCFIKGKKKRPLTILTSGDVCLLFEVFSTVGYWDVMWKHGRKCIDFLGGLLNYFYQMTHLVLSSWCLEKLYVALKEIDSWHLDC